MSDSNNTKLSENSKNSFIAELSEKVTKENLWENDCANRQEFAEKFVTIIDNIGAESSAAILLEGEWGTGKTFFLKSFRQHLDKEGYKAIYFDAFAEDFSADPLLAICGQLWKELSVSDSIKGSVNKNLTKVLKDIMIVGGVAAEALLHANNININIKENAKNLKTMGIGSLLEYAESRGKVEQLKTDLSSIVVESQSQEGKESDAKPLVFIIDELDRCRPTFALELLERVKHLFQVQGVIFVFGANKNSLNASVLSEYGNHGSAYFQKFFELELNLPDISPSILIRWHVKKRNYKIFNQAHWHGNNTMTIFFDGFYCPLINIMGLTLRQAERCMQKLEVFLLLLLGKDKISFVEAVAGAILIALKIKGTQSYKNIVQPNATCHPIFLELTSLFHIWVKSAKNMERLTYKDKEAKDFLHFLGCIFVLSEDQEKKLIEDYQVIARLVDGTFGAGATPPLDLTSSQVSKIRGNFIDRSELLAMLENLGCRS